MYSIGTYYYCMLSKKKHCSTLFDIFVRPCSTPCSTIACSTLFDTLVRHPCSTTLFDRLFNNLVRRRPPGLPRGPGPQPGSPILVRSLVRPLVQGLFGLVRTLGAHLAFSGFPGWGRFRAGLFGLSGSMVWGPVQHCSTACSTSLFDLVRLLVRHPCSKLRGACQK